MRALLWRVGRYALWEHGSLTAALAFALGMRLKLLQWWNPFPFGDVFNFVQIARSMMTLSYPVDEKRLPFYPLLILVTHTSLPGTSWESSAIGVAIAMSLLALALFYAIGRTLGITKAPLVAGVLVLAPFQPFLAYSIRGYADTTFVALLLAAILAALHLPKRWSVWTLGPILGLLCLTRYEGVAAAAVLLLVSFFRLRTFRPRGLVVFLFVLTLLPYAWLASRSGRSILPTAYLRQAAAEEGGYGATSLREVWVNTGEVWKRLGLSALWRTPKWFIGEVRDDALGSHKSITDFLSGSRSAVSVLAIPGIAYLLLRRRFRDVLTVALPFFAVSLPIAWWSPLLRYDAFLFPLMVLAAAAGLHAFLRVLARATHDGGWGRVVRFGAAAGIVGIAFFVWSVGSLNETYNNIKKSRHRELGFYRALQYAERLPAGTVAFERRLAITETYFGERAVYAEEFLTKDLDTAARWAALRKRGVTYVVVSFNKPSPLAFFAAGYTGVSIEELQRYAFEQGDHDISEAAVYRLEF